MRSAGASSRMDWIIRMSLLLIGTAMLWFSRDFSMSGDEPVQIHVGHETYMYLCRALGFLPGSNAHAALNNYGGLFGVVATNLKHWMPWWDEIHLRHCLIALCG